MAPRGWRVRGLGWRLSQPGFDPGYAKVISLTTLMSSDRMKQICLLMTIYHHHHIALVARISLTLSRHSSLSFIALGRSSGQQPVSSHSCWMYVRAGHPAFARPCVGIHKSSSLLLQQCPACLVRLTWIVFVIGGRWPYSWCLVGCCCQGYIYIYIYIWKYIYIYIYIYIVITKIWIHKKQVYWLWN